MNLSIIKFRKIAIQLFALFFVFALSSCGLIFKGTHEEVFFNSNPIGAEISVNGRTLGMTPIMLAMNCNDAYMIEFKKTGFQTFRMFLDNRMNIGYLVCDILFMPIPLLLDAITGAWYELNTHNVFIQLQEEKATK